MWIGHEVKQVGLLFRYQQSLLCSELKNRSVSNANRRGFRVYLGCLVDRAHHRHRVFPDYLVGLGRRPLREHRHRHRCPRCQDCPAGLHRLAGPRCRRAQTVQQASKSPTGSVRARHRHRHQQLIEQRSLGIVHYHRRRRCQSQVPSKTNHPSRSRWQSGSCRSESPSYSAAESQTHTRPQPGRRLGQDVPDR